MAVSADPADELASILAAHLPDRRIGRAVGDVLARADDAIAYFAPVCWNRGHCCRFHQAGHRLFVTTAELVHFAQTHAALPVDRAVGTCPYQKDGVCHARQARPLGCRVYFCQASSRWWQPAMTERCLRDLRRVCDELDVPYAYVEWLTALTALHQMANCSSTLPSL